MSGRTIADLVFSDACPPAGVRSLKASDPRKRDDDQTAGGELVLVKASCRSELDCWHGKAESRLPNWRSHTTGALILKSIDRPIVPPRVLKLCTVSPPFVSGQP